MKNIIKKVLFKLLYIIGVIIFMAVFAFFDYKHLSKTNYMEPMVLVAEDNETVSSDESSINSNNQVNFLTVYRVFGNTIGITIILTSIIKIKFIKLKLKEEKKKYESEITENNKKENLEKINELHGKAKEKINNQILRVAIGIIILIAAGILGLIRSFKPIIYIYPEHETEVLVSLGNEDLIDCSYPKYDNGWRILAKPNGDLIDLKTGRSLYSLYWEGGRFKKPDFKEGFVVKGEDSAKFLEEKLEILGLNYKEAEEFIVYWLPKMEKNKYNYIKFVSQEEIESTMPLEIKPKPDTLIRVYMQFKGLPFRIKVKEQELEKASRSGFTVVEWGGSEL